MEKNVFCFILLIVIPSEGISQSNAQKKIRELSSKFSQNYISGNCIEIANAYTDDAIILPPGKDVLIGKKNIYQYWDKLPKGNIILHRSDPIEIKIAKNTAYEYGFYYTQTKNEIGDLKPIQSAKYYIIWKKIKGEWKMYMDMWNGRDAEWNKRNSN